MEQEVVSMDAFQILVNVLDAPGMKWVVIVLFCVIRMCAWTVTLLVMKNYELTGERMKEIQAVNAKRKEAIAEGMTMEEAMKQIIN